MSQCTALELPTRGDVKWAEEEREGSGLEPLNVALLLSPCSLFLHTSVASAPSGCVALTLLGQPALMLGTNQVNDLHCSRFFTWAVVFLCEKPVEFFL